MKIKFKIYLLLFFAIALFSYYSFNPIVLNINNQSTVNDVENLQKEVVPIFDGINFNVGSFKALLIINDKIDIHSNFTRGRVFYTEDVDLLKKMQKKCVFHVTNSDLTTVENKLLLYKNDSIVYEEYVVLEVNKQGIQNSNHGWLLSKSQDLINFLSEFERLYIPIVFI
ncbi:hypothetical protein [Myroides sp. TSA_177.3]|uniref:hypothetical protein n=1 Tax=Myroides sp. TSA_177.3 TaxID=3415650 RepID=UPI0040456A72